MEPLLRLSLGIDSQPFLVDAYSGNNETVLVTHAVLQERHLKVTRAPGEFGIKQERVDRDPVLAPALRGAKNEASERRFSDSCD